MDNGIISVTGTGRIHVVPDVTRLEVSVGSVFQTYEAAYEAAKENSKWMVQILEYNKKSGKLAKTIYFDISDHLVNEYDDDDHYLGQIKDGFELKQRFKIDLGMDTVLLNKIVRGVGKFIKDASEKAEIMAKAAGSSLGEVKEIRYGEQPTHVYSEARNIHSNKEAMACDGESLNISPDDLVMTEIVEVVWWLGEK